MNKRGLFGKYIIAKANGEPVDPEARYFVLRYDRKSKDSVAREVLLEYARRSGNPKLAEDIKLEMEPHETEKA